MHHEYQTEGLVLASFPEGEASRFYLIFTHDLGLVGATARSTRREDSRLRYSLQDLSLATIVLVRGKERWRVINAVSRESFYEQTKNDPRKLSALAKIAALIRKLVAGEEKHPELFKEVLSVYRYITEVSSASEFFTDVQLISALRILRLLGYLPQGKFEPYTVFYTWNIELLENFKLVRKDAVNEVRKILAVTQV